MFLCTKACFLCARECISEQQSKVDGRRVNGKIHVAEVNDSRDNPSHIRQRENGERRDEDIQAGSKEMNGQSAMKDKGEEEPHGKDHSSWSCPNRYRPYGEKHC